LRKILDIVPLKRLMIETDGPFMFPKNIDLKLGRNEPCFLVDVLFTISEILNLDKDELAKITFQNTKEFFNI
jgi:TatD DNase family protein